MSTTGMIEWETAGRLDNATGAVVKSMTLPMRSLRSEVEGQSLGIAAILSHFGDYEDAFEETEGLLPCAFQTMFDVRRMDGEIYLDAGP